MVLNFLLADIDLRFDFKSWILITNTKLTSGESSIKINETAITAGKCQLFEPCPIIGVIGVMPVLLTVEIDLQL